MHTNSSYIDFFFNGISFASNTYNYEAFQKPWELGNEDLVKIQKTWSKNFWISAGVSLCNTIAAINCSFITTPQLAAALAITFIALSIFSIYRLSQAYGQNVSWSPTLLSIYENLYNAELNLSTLEKEMGKN